MDSSRPIRPIKFPRGDSYVHELRLRDGDGDPINLANRSYTAQIRRKADDTSVVATFVCTVANVNTGNVTLTLPKNVTAGITPGNYVYDVVETNTSTGTELTLMRGPVTVEKDVTRA